MRTHAGAAAALVLTLASVAGVGRAVADFEDPIDPGNWVSVLDPIDQTDTGASVSVTSLNAYIEQVDPALHNQIEAAITNPG